MSIFINLAKNVVVLVKLDNYLTIRNLGICLKPHLYPSKLKLLEKVRVQLDTNSFSGHLQLL